MAVEPLRSPKQSQKIRGHLQHGGDAVVLQDEGTARDEGQTGDKGQVEDEGNDEVRDVDEDVGKDEAGDVGKDEDGDMGKDKAGVEDVDEGKRGHTLVVLTPCTKVMIGTE